MDVTKLIPKNKFDEEPIEELRKLSFEQIEAIVPELLEWLQDMHWPVARAVAEILKPFADKITTEIIEVLKTNDSIWEYWVLINLARNTTDPLLLSEIARIAKFPSKVEIEDEVDVEARFILKGKYR